MKLVNSGATNMCRKCDAYKGPVEIEQFTCGLCCKCVSTFWIPWYKAMLHGKYTVIGDKVFHDKCAEEYVKPLEERTA